MGRIRSFITGAALGSAAMFFALQYHVVKAPSGVKVIPRTPRQSLGLAYNDVRGWDARRWADRLELAQALMANGSSDLIAESVVSSLGDMTAEKNSTVDQLRDFLRESRLNSGLNLNEETRVAVNAAAGWGQAQALESETPVESSDPFRAESSAAATGRFSTAQIREVQRPVLGSTSGETAEAAADRIRRQAEQAERLLFGNLQNDSDAVVRPATTVPSESPPALEEAAPFEEVTSALQRQATEMLQEIAHDSGTPATSRDADGIVSGFVRDAKDAATATAVEAIRHAAEKTESAGDMVFDPFLLN